MSSKTPNLADLGEQAWESRHDDDRPAETQGWETVETGLGRTEYVCDSCETVWDYPQQMACAKCGGSIVRTTMIDPEPLELTPGRRIRRALGLEKLEQPPAALNPSLAAALEDIIPATRQLGAILARIEVAIGAQDCTGWSDTDRAWLGRLQLGCGSAHGGDVSRNSLNLPLSGPLRALALLAGEAHPEAG